MNIVTGEIARIVVEHQSTVAHVNVRGAVFRVPLALLPEARLGDTVVIHAGVAVSIIRPSIPEQTA